MLHFDAATAIMAAIGFLLHFLGRYAEFWRTGGKVGPVAYVRNDLPGWLFATVATYRLTRSTCSGRSQNSTRTSPAARRPARRRAISFDFFCISPARRRGRRTR